MIATKITASPHLPINRESFSNVTLLAAELANRYEDGFLPNAGGWMDQDEFFVNLISEGISARRERERIEDRKRAARSKLRHK